MSSIAAPALEGREHREDDREVDERGLGQQVRGVLRDHREDQQGHADGDACEGEQGGEDVLVHFWPPARLRCCWTSSGVRTGSGWDSGSVSPRSTCSGTPSWMSGDAI